MAKIDHSQNHLKNFSVSSDDYQVMFLKNFSVSSDDYQVMFFKNFSVSSVDCHRQNHYGQNRS
jgi:hypothetical protein